MRAPISYRRISIALPGATNSGGAGVGGGSFGGGVGGRVGLAVGGGVALAGGKDGEYEGAALGDGVGVGATVTQAAIANDRAELVTRLCQLRVGPAR